MVRLPAQGTRHVPSQHLKRVGSVVTRKTRGKYSAGSSATLQSCACLSGNNPMTDTPVEGTDLRSVQPGTVCVRPCLRSSKCGLSLALDWNSGQPLKNSGVNISENQIRLPFCLKVDFSPLLSLPTAPIWYLAPLLAETHGPRKAVISIYLSSPGTDTAPGSAEDPSITLSQHLTHDSPASLPGGQQLLKR